MSKKEDIGNVVYVGKKDSKVYVLAVTTQASQNDTVILRGRGKAISKAVDVSQISVNKFLKGWKIGKVKLGTEERPAENAKKGQDKKEQRPSRVSYIEIELTKG